MKWLILSAPLGRSSGSLGMEVARRRAGTREKRRPGGLRMKMYSYPRQHSVLFMSAKSKSGAEAVWQASPFSHMLQHTEQVGSTTRRGPLCSHPQSRAEATHISISYTDKLAFPLPGRFPHERLKCRRFGGFADARHAALQLPTGARGTESVCVCVWGGGGVNMPPHCPNKEKAGDADDSERRRGRMNSRGGSVRRKHSMLCGPGGGGGVVVSHSHCFLFLSMHFYQRCQNVKPAAASWGKQRQSAIHRNLFLAKVRITTFSLQIQIEILSHFDFCFSKSPVLLL